jgi:hypothetical protein
MQYLEFWKVQTSTCKRRSHWRAVSSVHCLPQVRHWDGALEFQWGYERIPTFLLYLCRPMYVHTLRWTNPHLRIPTKYLQARSREMHPFFSYETLLHWVFGSRRFETICYSHPQRSKRPRNPKRGTFCTGLDCGAIQTYIDTQATEFFFCQPLLHIRDMPSSDLHRDADWLFGFKVSVVTLNMFR